ncbi:MAG TPA: hypothetical protein VD813_04585 [Pseudonocardia sp.]|nr:hypothetical protein [Pseudonocardia sp.]
MIVRLEAEGAVVLDADDCGRLHLETALAGDGLRAALRATGSGEPVDDATVLLDLSVLRARARLAATAPDWPQRWEQMVEYARRKGWLSDDGRSVQVHVERTPG